MTLAEVSSDAQIVRHSRWHVARTKDSMFSLHLQLEGESVSRQDGRESALRVGDFTLCDSTRRYEMIVTGANRMLVLGMVQYSVSVSTRDCICCASASWACSIATRS